MKETPITLDKMYYNILNFNPRIYVSKHVCERIVERKINPEHVILLLKQLTHNLCLTIYECEIQDGRKLITGFGIRLPVTFQKESMKLTIRTVY